MKNSFKSRCPNCGMYEEKGEGIKKNNTWFCSKECMKKFEEKLKSVPNHKCC